MKREQKLFMIMLTLAFSMPVHSAEELPQEVVEEIPAELPGQLPEGLSAEEAAFFANYNPENPEPIAVAKPQPPESIAKLMKEEVTLFTLDVPLIGALKLVPFNDDTKQPPQSGFKIKFADATRKLNLGAMTIDEGEIALINDVISMTGQATIFDHKARFGIKEIDFVAALKFIKRIVLGVTFLTKPTLELIPGAKLEIETADLEIERDKPIILRTQQTLFGQKVVISFELSTDRVDASCLLTDTDLVNIIPSVAGTPLASGKVKGAGLQIKNVYAKDRAEKLTAILSGKIDLTTTDLSSDPQAVSDLTLTCTMKSDGVEAAIAAQKFPLASIGTINEAKIIIKAGRTDATKENQEKASITLSGDLDFVIADLGTLGVSVASKISDKGLEFSGEIKKPFSYLGIDLKKGKVLFDTAQKMVNIVGDISFEGLDLTATYELKPDPATPADLSRRIVEFKAKAKATSFEPFRNTGIPVINTFKITNLDAGIEIIQKPGEPDSKAIALDGDIEILNVSLRSLIKFVVNEQGQKGIYINAPLPANWTFSQSIKELRGTVFDTLIFEQASFVVCNIDYTDPQKNIAVKKGLQFYAKVPLSGALQPVGDFLGSKGQKFTMFGTITPRLKDLVLGIKIAEGVPVSTATVSIGDTEVILEAGGTTPSFGLKANVIVRPSSKDILTFVGQFKFGATEATLEAGMSGTWKNPFGINGLSLSDTYLSLGMKYGSPTPTKFGIAAKMGLSSTTSIEFAVVADATMEHMALKGKASKLSFLELINAFAKPMGAEIPDPNVPLLDLRDVDIRFAATDTRIGEVLIAQGVTMKAKMDLLGKEKVAELDVNIDTGGIKIKGYTQPLEVQGLLKVSGLSGKDSPCNIRVEGAANIDRPQVDIELTLARQVFLVQGAMLLGSEAAGIFYKTASCLIFSRSGIAFEFLSQVGSNRLLYSRVKGASSGSLTNPQFELSIDFEQHLQQFIKDAVNDAFNAAQKEVVDGINTAQHEIDKIDGVIADSNRKMKDAEQQVARARSSLASIQSAIDESDRAFRSAQRDVDSIGDEITKLTKWWDKLPDY